MRNSTIQPMRYRHRPASEKATDEPIRNSKILANEKQPQASQSETVTDEPVRSSKIAANENQPQYSQHSHR